MSKYEVSSYAKGIKYASVLVYHQVFYQTSELPVTIQ